MELLERELNDPNSPRPPPLPPRPPQLPSVHSTSAPSLETPAGSPVTSRPHGNQSASLGDIAGHGEERAEPRYVSAPQAAARPPKSATAVASQLRAHSRRRGGVDRARTCDEEASTMSDVPPALPPPRKFSLQLDSVAEPAAAASERTGSRSPPQHHHHHQQKALRPLPNSPEPPSTPTGDRSPRSSPNLPPHAKHS